MPNEPYEDPDLGEPSCLTCGEWIYDCECDEIGPHLLAICPECGEWSFQCDCDGSDAT